MVDDSSLRQASMLLNNESGTSTSIYELAERSKGDFEARNEFLGKLRVIADVKDELFSANFAQNNLSLCRLYMVCDSGPLPYGLQVFVEEVFLFQSLRMNSQTPEKLPFFVHFAAALRGAILAASSYLTDPECLIIGNGDVDSKTLYLKEGEVGNNPFKSLVVNLTMPLFNRYARIVGEGWKQGLDHFEEYRLQITSMYYDYLLDEPNGGEFSNLQKQACAEMYQYYDEDCISSKNGNPYAYKQNDILFNYSQIQRPVTLPYKEITSNPCEEDIRAMWKTIEIGTKAMLDIIWEDWPNNWPYKEFVENPVNFDQN